MPKLEKRTLIILTGVIILIGMGGLIFSQTTRIKDIKYLGINYRDPFLSFIPQERKEVKVEVVKPPDLKLQGIVWGGPSPRAIINNTVLGKGDAIQGAQILDVRKEGVEFFYKGEEFFIDRISGTVSSVSDIQK